MPGGIQIVLNHYNSVERINDDIEEWNDSVDIEEDLIDEERCRSDTCYDCYGIKYRCCHMRHQCGFCDKCGYASSRTIWCKCDKFDIFGLWSSHYNDE